MRILLVTPYYIPAWGFGGPVKVVSDLAGELVRRGHQVTVATTDVLDQRTRIAKREDMIQGARIVYFPNPSAYAAFKWNIYIPKGFKAWLSQHIKEFDAIHCHDFYTGLNTVVSQVAVPAGVPYWIQPHGALIPTRMEARRLFLKRWWLKRFRNVPNQAAQIIASTEIERRELLSTLGLPPERVVVIPNGLEASAIVQLVPDESKRRQLHLQPTDFIILYFGRIQFIKGIDISLASLALIKDVPWKFLIIGRDDGQQASLTAQANQLGIAPQVQFLGPQFGKDLEAIMSISNVFLFNSRSESFPIAVLNACAAGLPMILSPACRLPEVAEWGAGMVLSENTPAATAAALRQMYRQPNGRAAMATAGQKLIREKFTLERVVDQCEQIYKTAS